VQAVKRTVLYVPHHASLEVGNGGVSSIL